MKKNKLLALCCAVALVCTLLSGCVNVADVGTVNDKKISMGTFNLFALSAVGEVIQENALSSYEDFEALNVNGVSGKDMAIDRAYDLILQRYTAERLFYAAGNKLTDEQENAVNSYITDLITSMGGQANFEKELKTLGVSQSEFKDFQRANVIYSVYANMIYGEAGTQPVTEADIKAYFDENYVCAKHILLSTVDQTTQEPLPEDKKAEARKKAEEALAKARSGADFDQLITEYNEDPGMASSPKGYVFTKGEMVAPFEEAAFALPVDGISDIVESKFGYHIIKKLDKNADPTIYEEKKEEVASHLVSLRFEDYIESNKAQTSIQKNEAQAQKIDFKKFLVNG